MAAERVLITGTTRGIGRALLERYQRSRAEVISVNRRHDAELEARYPAVRFERADVRSPVQVTALLEGLVAEGRVPDLFLLNAGINHVDNDEVFRLGPFRDVLDTNLYGVVNFIQPLTELPRARRPRHVVAIGSMARHVGNPYGLGYHTSKRALSACFDVWAHMYEGTDLVFQQAVLGPVATDITTMASDFPRWMRWARDAFSGTPEAAAEAIARFARTRQKTLYHPRRAVPLYLGMWLGQQLVPGFFRGRQTRSGRPRREAPPSVTDEKTSPMRTLPR